MRTDVKALRVHIADPVLTARQYRILPYLLNHDMTLMRAAERIGIARQTLATEIRAILDAFEVTTQARLLLLISAHACAEGLDVVEAVRAGTPIEVYPSSWDRPRSGKAAP